MSENEKKMSVVSLPKIDETVKTRLERVSIIVGALSDLDKEERGLVLNAVEVLLGDDER